MALPEVRITHLHPRDLRDRREKRALAWLPVGTIEWHGHHLPMGFDGIKAELLCVAGARRGGGVVFPAMFYGDHRGIVIESLFAPVSGFRMSFDHRKGVNEALGTSTAEMSELGSAEQRGGAGVAHIELLERTFWMIRSYGFTRIVALSGHYPSAKPLRRASDQFHAAQSECKVLSGTEADFAGWGGDHAGSFETSQLMALAPQLVRINQVDDAIEPLGVMGSNPAGASAAEGDRIVDAFVEGALKAVGDVPQMTMRTGTDSTWPSGDITTLMKEAFDA